MKRISILSAIYFSCILLMAPCIFNAAYAQQQQYANAYTFWKFGEGADNVQNIEQKIWIAKQAPGSQWVMTWKWVADPAHGGYLGFNTDANGNGQMLYSLWNADQAIGENCRKFGGEGVGWSCRKPISLRSDVFYLFRLSRIRTDDTGVWWGAWIIEDPDADQPIEYSLGEIRVKSEMNLIRGNSVYNFSEYFGRTVANCNMVPVSIFGVSPPLANKDENGKFDLVSVFNGYSDPKRNPCQTGNEPQGSLFTVESYDFGSGPGAIIFFGGTKADHSLPEGTQVPGKDN